MHLMRFFCVGGIIGAVMLSGGFATAGDSSEPATPSADQATSPAATPQATTTPAGTTTTPAGAPTKVVDAPVPGTTKADAGALPQVGGAAGDFTLVNGEGKPTALKDYRGQWVVLYFYPKDFTGGCTLEAHEFQADQEKYNQLNTVILGVSVDTPESHKEFCAKEKLTFKLLSDPGAKVSTQYGSVMEYEGAKLSARNTFIIAPDGKIAKVFTKVNPTGHSAQVLAALNELSKQTPKPQG
jgi:peroxiredoxin Q/BCP